MNEPSSGKDPRQRRNEGYGFWRAFDCPEPPCFLSVNGRGIHRGIDDSRDVDATPSHQHKKIETSLGIPLSPHVGDDDSVSARPQPGKSFFSRPHRLHLAACPFKEPFECGVVLGVSSHGTEGSSNPD